MCIRDRFKDDKLNVKSVFDQVKVQTDLKDLLGNMEDSSSEESSDSSNSESSNSESSNSESSMENRSEDSSMEEVNGGGQKGGAKIRSYYLKRLKENDKELFNPDKPWSVKQKNGDLYGYAKLCAAGNVDRQPISVTTEELKRINTWNDKESGEKSYSNSTTCLLYTSPSPRD